MNIGTRIKKIRTRQQRTLQEIADACGCTKSLLSKIENSRTIPPVATLMKIASALGVRTSIFLEEDSGLVTILRRADSVDRAKMVKTESGYRFLAFASERSNKLIQPFLFIARKGEIKKHGLSHAGEEFVYVLEGRMKYRVGGIEYELGKGDSLYFDSEEEHSLEPLTDEVLYLGIFAEYREDSVKPEKKGREK